MAWSKCHSICIRNDHYFQNWPVLPLIAHWILQRHSNFSFASSYIWVSRKDNQRTAARRSHGWSLGVFSAEVRIFPSFQGPVALHVLSFGCINAKHRHQWFKCRKNPFDPEAAAFNTLLWWLISSCACRLPHGLSLLRHPWFTGLTGLIMWDASELWKIFLLEFLNASYLLPHSFGIWTMNSDASLGSFQGLSIPRFTRRYRPQSPTMCHF